MSEIVVRPLEEQDLDGFFAVRSLTYNNGDPIPEERRRAEPPGVKSFVAIHDGQVSGICTTLEMSASRGRAVIPCAAVAAVGVLPEKRKSGIGSTMMSWLVNHLGENGIPLTSLYAFREPFYRRFGYEVAGRRLKIGCPTERLPRVTSALRVRRLKPSDWELLEECYVAFSDTRSGLSKRNDYLWHRVLGENRPLTIYAVGDPVEAYAVVSHQSNFWTTDHISEVAWSTRRGYDGLLSLLPSFAINKKGLSWYEPSDGPFYGDHLDEGIEVKIDRPIMFRVTDVQIALHQLKPDPSLSGEFVLSLEDHIVHSNHGTWRVRFEEGTVSAERAEENASWDLKMNIHKFAQAFLGEPGLTQLVANESIEIGSKSGLAQASLLLPDQSVYCMDFF